MSGDPRRARTDAPRAFRSLYAAGLAAALLAGMPAAAGPLPDVPAPDAPFPPVVASSAEHETIAPGVERRAFHLTTTAGPLVVSVVRVDPREPTVRFGAVLAHDTIASPDETASSMARRTGAVAGVNGDYFDINASGVPLGLLVRDGTLLRSPGTRPAVTVGPDGRLGFGTVAFGGTVSGAAGTVPLTGINVWPPAGGASLLTASFGPIPPGAADVALVDLQPSDRCCGGGRYRAAAVAVSPPWPAAAGARLAYGPAARAAGALPQPGDELTVAYDTDPPLAGIATAVGGGPMLLQNGVAVDDPASPNYAERGRRIPATAVARLADGTVALVVVDGRRPATSIGVNRAELIALLRALGSVDAMLFDSGGSATMVARVLGDAGPSVVNEPSDGVERPVADGLFVYSSAPAGPPSRLIVRPPRVVAVPGARVPLRGRLADVNGHGFGDAPGTWHAAASPVIASVGADGLLVAGAQPGTGIATVARGGLMARLPVEVVDRVARLAIGPPRVNPDPHGAVVLTLDAFDARDRAVATAGTVRWSARDAAIDESGRLVAGDRDAVVTASAGGASTTLTVPVGRHRTPLALADPARTWRLVTAPAGGPGAVETDGGALVLTYDFSAGGRAAYAAADVPLGDALALTCTVEGDAHGAALRATLSDRYGDREPVTFARSIDFSGPRRLTAPVRASLAPPLVLHNVYVAGTLANPPVTAAGTIRVRDCEELVPGAQPARAAAHASPPAKSTAPRASAHAGGAAATASAG